LDGDQRPSVTTVVDLGVESFGPLPQCVEHDGRVRGVGDDEVSLLSQPVHDEVVEDAAVW
jgi:hypothetical protein